jgi:hypothetical protein
MNGVVCVFLHDRARITLPPHTMQKSSLKLLFKGGKMIPTNATLSICAQGYGACIPDCDLPSPVEKKWKKPHKYKSRFRK